MKTIVVLLFILSFSFNSFSQLDLNVETGLVFSGYNSVRIPGNTGTRFSLSEELTSKPSVFYRLRSSYSISDKHHLSILYAPLSLFSSGELDRDLNFNGETFTANSQLDSLFKFNSYRLTYRYDFIHNDNYQFGLGLTGKIRDAEISIESNGITSSEKNIGFVPLINFNFWWMINKNYSILFQGDALAAPQGRAEDVLLALQYRASDSITYSLGYRVVEGGASNETVYNFALIHYLVFGMNLTF